MAVMRVFKVELQGIPRVLRIVAACDAVDAFARAAPGRQAGAPAA